MLADYGLVRSRRHRDLLSGCRCYRHLLFDHHKWTEIRWGYGRGWKSKWSKFHKQSFFTELVVPAATTKNTLFWLFLRTRNFFLLTSIKRRRPHGHIDRRWRICVRAVGGVHWLIRDDKWLFFDHGTCWLSGQVDGFWRGLASVIQVWPINRSIDLTFDLYYGIPPKSEEINSTAAHNSPIYDEYQTQ